MTRGHSELEYVVLGVVWDAQPCTAYAVRKVFVESPSSHWSGSAGAIYPLLRRLQRQGLLRSRVRRGDQRGSRLFQLTDAGRAALRAWLQPPLPSASSLMSVDMLRVRMRFFGALPARGRQAVLAEAAQKLTAQLEVVRADAARFKRAGDTFAYLMARGAVLSVRAQLAWLREAREQLRSGG